MNRITSCNGLIWTFWRELNSFCDDRNHDKCFWFCTCTNKCFCFTNTSCVTKSKGIIIVICSRKHEILSFHVLNKWFFFYFIRTNVTLNHNELCSGCGLILYAHYNTADTLTMPYFNELLYCLYGSKPAPWSRFIIKVRINVVYSSSVLFNANCESN